MRQLALKKKESRLVWQVLFRGIVAMDRMKHADEKEREAYQAVRHKMIAAWRGGIILGGVRPKKSIEQIMPAEILRESVLAKFAKASKRDSAIVNEKIRTPHKKPAT